MNDIIKVENLVKHYDKVKAVDDISFTVEKASLFAFLGPNGAGKSTTIKILCTLLEQDSGEICISDYKVGKSDTFIRDKIGVVFQESLLDPLLTVKENLETRAAFYAITGKKFRTNLDKIADILSIEDILNRQYGKLSGGQRRRTDIARALINTPDILFLDEPTTGLDPQTRIKVWDTIRKMQKNDGTTIFLTTHYMDEAAKADYVSIIDHGKLIAQGTPYELRLKYSSDKLKISSNNSEAMSAVLKESDIDFKRLNGIIIIELSDTKEAIDLLNKYKEYIDAFEVIHGNMDDVFINTTGHTIRED